jgi:hypothetical protein
VNAGAARRRESAPAVFTLTGVTATQFGAALQAGWLGQLYVSAGGALKEPTIFTITSVSAPAFGFRNIFLDRPTTVLAAGGNVFKVGAYTYS